jgi:molybdopterin-guanine dinucleotide biosynthesis protein A
MNKRIIPRISIPPAAAVVLAGGESRRMGTDKAFLPVFGEPMISVLCRHLASHFREVLISANDVEKFAFLGLSVVRDREPMQGPLMAIFSSLLVSRHDLNFLVACDIPDPDLRAAGEMLNRAVDFDAVIPRDSSGRLQPLFAVYRKSVLAALENALERGVRKVADALDGCRVLRPILNEQIANLNTPEEYENYTRKLNASS